MLWGPTRKWGLVVGGEDTVIITSQGLSWSPWWEPIGGLASVVDLYGRSLVGVGPKLPALLVMQKRGIHHPHGGQGTVPPGVSKEAGQDHAGDGTPDPPPQGRCLPGVRPAELVHHGPSTEGSPRGGEVSGTLPPHCPALFRGEGGQ